MNSNFYKLENTPLVCLLGDEILNIEKNLSFRFFQRFRYYFLVDSSYSALFRKYFTEKQLLVFKREWIVFNLLINIIRKEEDSLPHVKLFVEQMRQLYGTEVEIEGGFFMKVLAGFYLIRFTPENKENIRMLLLDFINASEKKTTTKNQSYFALLVSNLSNLFYKNKMRKDSMELKKQSFEIARGMKSSIDQPRQWDSHFKSSNFEMKSYDLMKSMIENEDNEIEHKYQSLKGEKAGNLVQDVEKNLIQSVYFQKKKDKESLRLSVVEAQSKINQMQGFEKDMYQAILDSIPQDQSKAETSKETLMKQLAQES